MAIDTPLEPPTAVSAVVVVAPRLPPWQGDAVFSVTRLDAATVQDTPRLDEALTQVPGVDLFRRNSSLGANPTTQGLSMRGVTGSGAGRSLVTLDGVPQNDPFGNWVIWSGIPAASLSGVDIVRGAGAGPYGSGALTGVVALDERSSKTPWYYVDGSYGELGDRQASAAGETSLGPFRFMGVASGEHADGYYAVHEGRGPADAKLGLDSGSVAGRVETDLLGGVLSARVGYSREARGSGLAGTIAGQPGSASSTHSATGSVTYAKAPTGDDFGYRLQVWDHASQLSNTSYSVSETGGIRTNTALTNNEYSTPANEFGVNGALRRAGINWTLEAGVDYRKIRGTDHEKFGAGAVNNRQVGGQQEIQGAYLEATDKIGAWLIAGGVRDDYWQTSNAVRIQRTPAGAETPGSFVDQVAPDAHGNLPTARFGVKYDATSDLSVRAAAYEGFRVPSLNELVRPFTVGTTITEANPSLSPEKLIGGEIGLDLIQGPFTWSVTAFDNVVQKPITNVTLCSNPSGTCSVKLQGYSNLTTATTAAGGILKQRQNGRDVKAQGVEASGAYALNDVFNLRGAIDYTHARQGQLRPAQAADLTADAGFDWRVIPAVKLSADAHYEGSRFEDDLNSQVLNPDTTLDARIDYTVRPGMVFYVAGDNLTDANTQTGYSNASNTVSGGTPASISFLNYGPPRQLRVGITLSH